MHPVHFDAAIIRRGLECLLHFYQGGIAVTGSFILLVVAGAIVALLVFWFVYAYKVLRKMSIDVRRAEEQMQLHQDGWTKVRGDPEEKAAARMLETSIQIYEQVSQSYRQVFEKPIYRFPGFIMGFPTTARTVHPK